MASSNGRPAKKTTFEGAPAKRITPYEELRRSVMACLLWEDEFYENGTNIAERIKTLCNIVPREQVKELALEAKYTMGIRHTPLWMMVSADIWEKDFIKKMIRRPDDMMEILGMYWKDGKKPLPNQLKKAFRERILDYDDYQLAKYQRLGREIKLRDVLRLVHPKPKNLTQNDWFGGVINGTIPPPDTWESNLMMGGDKREVFESLIAEKKLPALAMLRNLRGMKVAGVGNIDLGLSQMNPKNILPFQFVNSWRFAPEYGDILEKKMFEGLAEMPKFDGKTILLVDTSGSMDSPLSAKSDMRRVDAARGLAVIVRALCDDIEMYSFDVLTKRINPLLTGFALAKSIPANGWGTNLGAACRVVQENHPDAKRLIVLTDEQSHDRVPDPSIRGYMVNIASARNGVGYHPWVHIDGWSQGIIKYIQEYERIYG